MFCLIAIVIFHLLSLVFKFMALKSATTFYMIKNMLESLQALLAIIYLADAKVLLNLLKVEFAHLVNMVGKGDINKFLLV